MGDAPVQPAALEVDEPVAAIRRRHPRALMRPVDAAVPLPQDDSVLVLAVNPPTAQHRLPARRHAARGSKDVVPAIPLVDLRAFNRRVICRAVEQEFVLADGVRAVRAHREDTDSALEPDAAVRVGVDDVRPTVVVPERAGVNQPFARPHELRRVPLPAGIRRAHHVDALVRHPVIDVEKTIVPADGGRPHAARVAGDFVARFGDVGQRVVHQPPVDQLRRGQNRQPRHIVERGCRHVVGVAEANHVGVGVVAAQHGIAVAAVALVGEVQFVRHCAFPPEVVLNEKFSIYMDFSCAEKNPSLPCKGRWRISAGGVVPRHSNPSVRLR